jgi:hypothetical protein
VGIDIPSHICQEINYFFKKQLINFGSGIDLYNEYSYHLTFAYIGKITETQTYLPQLTFQTILLENLPTESPTTLLQVRKEVPSQEAIL